MLRKGIAYESTIYGGNGSRNFDFDMDIFVKPKNAEEFTEFMIEIGYQIGKYNDKLDKVEPHPRKDVLIYKLNPDHLLPFSMITGNSLCTHTCIDVATSFTWFQSDYQVPMEDAFNELVLQPTLDNKKVNLKVLSPDFQVISTGLHLFKEAWFERWVDFEQDVNLLKFCDMIYLWNNHKESLVANDFKKQIIQLKIEKPIVWVLEHMDRVFNLNSIKTLGLSSFVEEDWLSSGYSSNGKYSKWEGTMRARLYDKRMRKFTK